ncbi:MAG TPA: acyl-CoA dehydrogenase family protein [Candidatus Dietzia intestinipullorum]|nr:acyl-CoA dehydrogenase family protein [Candidatus Dietzia intestinipullorum]
MEFALDPEITDFATSVDSLLASSDMPSVIRAWNDGDTDPGTRVWGRVAETGATALLIGEDSGGAGATAVEAMVALEVLGRHAVPGPVVESVMVAPRIAGALGGDSDLGDVAGEIAGGALATVAVPGVSPFAPDPHVASHTWVADDDSVFLGTAGEHRRSVDRARTVTRPEPGARIAAASTTDLVNHGALGTAAQLQGLGRAMLDMTVDYAKQRKQYGRFIGEYQALKHQLADVAIALEMSRPLLWAGALSLAENPDDPAASVRDVSAARVAVADAAYLSARTALQLHGAIGYTLEHDLGLLLTKTRALQTAWGTQAFHRGRVLEAIR